MTDNDYIAEYIKENYPTLLGLDFALWKMGKITFNVGRKIVEVFNNVDWSKYTLSDVKERDNNDT